MHPTLQARHAEKLNLNSTKTDRMFADRRSRKKNRSPSHKIFRIFRGNF
jgi:hypothetical protein